MSPTINTDGIIGSEVQVNAKRSYMLTVARKSSLLYWGQESRRIQILLFLFLMMTRKAVVGGAPNSDCYGVHAMDGLGSFRKDNAERRIFRSASSRSGLGMNGITPKSEAFRASLVA